MRTGAIASYGSDRPRAYEVLTSCAARRSRTILRGLFPPTDSRTAAFTSACPIYSAVPTQPAAAELLADLSKVLTRWGRWYVFGAQAVIAYGVPRLSADVDVTIELRPEEPQRFAGEMQAAGFALRVEGDDFIRRTRVMPFVHVATAMPLDIVLAGSGLEDEFLDRARVVDISGVSVPVIDPEDLIIAKVLAGRSKDIDDARSLWRLHGHELDAERVRGTLGLLEEALGQSDLMPAFESIVKDARAR